MNNDNLSNIDNLKLLDEEPLLVSASPHIYSKDSISKIMWTVTCTLIPAALFGIYSFGLNAFITIILSILSACTFEAIVLKLRRKVITLDDGSAILTGLLLAMCLPPKVPFYIPIVGSFVAIVIAKHSMGGLGYNIFNPAHIGRAALVLSWPVTMTKWTSMPSAVDTVTTATPLGILKHEGYGYLVQTFGGHFNMYKSLLLGLRNGCIGETSVILLLIGGIYLIYKGYIDWIVPTTMISLVGILTWIFGPNGFFTGDPMFHMMAGGLIIGAFFMATDMVTTPITRKGKFIFAAGAASITVLIRLIGGYPEGVCYSILLMNSVTPLIDRITSVSTY